jgi:hypothetical protein
MDMAMNIIQIEGMKTWRGISLPLGVGTTAEIGDMLALVAPATMGVVLLVMIVEEEDAIIIGKTIATGGPRRRFLLLVTQRAKKVKRRTRGTLPGGHIQMHQQNYRRREMMTFLSLKAFLPHCVLNARSESRFAMKRMSVGGGAPYSANSSSSNQLTTRLR